MMRRSGVWLSTLMKCLGFVLDIICIDVLHTCDLGIAQDTLGNRFWYAIMCGLFKSKKKSERVHKPWDAMKQYYNRVNPSTRITNLTIDMIKRDNKAPKLRTKGAETHHLVGFGLELAKATNDHCKPRLSLLMYHMMQCLFGFYNTLVTTPFQPDECESHGNNYLALYMQIPKVTPDQVWGARSLNTKAAAELSFVKMVRR